MVALPGALLTHREVAVLDVLHRHGWPATTEVRERAGLEQHYMALNALTKLYARRMAERRALHPHTPASRWTYQWALSPATVLPPGAGWSSG